MGALEAQTSGGPRARALASASMIRCLLAVLALAGVAHADGGDWERIADRDGIVIERRGVEGSSVREVRITTHATLPPAAIMAMGLALPSRRFSSPGNPKMPLPIMQLTTRPVMAQRPMDRSNCMGKAFAERSLYHPHAKGCKNSWASRGAGGEGRRRSWGD